MKALFYILFVVTLFLFSCERNDDFSRISEDYVYDAEFAITAGKIEYSSENINFPGGFIPANIPIPPLRDTFPFDMSNLARDSGFIEKMTFNFVIRNEFPVKSRITVYFANTFRKVIDQLDDTIRIDQASLSGDTTIAHSTNQYIEVNKEQIDRWKDVRYVIAVAVLENPNNNLPTSYLKNRKLRIETGVRLRFNFNVKDAL